MQGFIMQVRVAEDRDFERLKQLCDRHDGWSLEYDQPPTKVFTRPTKNSTFQMIKVMYTCTTLMNVKIMQMNDKSIWLYFSLSY